jgi:HlyD family secretion protein
MIGKTLNRLLFAGGLAAAIGCAPSLGPAGRVVPVVQQDLALYVEVVGTLKSIDSDQIGPPPSVFDCWQFKIISMASEGKRVAAGDEVIAFDPSDLEKQLKDYESDYEKTRQEYNKKSSDSELARLSGRKEEQAAEARRRVAEMKADKPADLVQELKLRESAIERDLAQRETAFLHEREQVNSDLAQARLRGLALRLQRSAGQVTLLKSEIQAMSVHAQRAGTVVYKPNGRGEKRKVGDPLSKMEAALEIASLERMAAQGQVDEVDASQIGEGQKVRLRLEAHPDKEYAGVVERIARLVQTESPDSRVRVVQLDIKLSETDPMVMRPNMRFRGRIEIARVPSAVQVPIEAVESTASGPAVMQLGDDGTQRLTPIQLGRRSGDAVQITGGLRAGDRVLLRAAGSAKGRAKPLSLGVQ